MKKIINFTTIDDKDDYIDINIRMLKNMDFFKNRISKSKYLIPLYTILTIGSLFLVYYQESSNFLYGLLFASIILLYCEINLKSGWIKRTKKIYSKEFDFVNKTTNYLITKDFVESTCEFQTLKYNWNDLTDFYERSDELEFDFYKKGMIVLRKKSLKQPADFDSLVNDLKSLLRDNPVVNRTRHFA